MTEHAISVRLEVRLEGGRIAIETIVDDPGFKRVANTSYLDPDAAIRLGEGLIRLGRLARGGLMAPTEIAPVKTLPLAVLYDPHAWDCS